MAKIKKDLKRNHSKIYRVVPTSRGYEIIDINGVEEKISIDN